MIISTFHIVILSTHERSISFQFHQGIKSENGMISSTVKCAINCDHEKVAAMKLFLDADSMYNHNNLYLCTFLFIVGTYCFGLDHSFDVFHMVWFIFS